MLPNMVEEAEDDEAALLTLWHVSWLPALLDADGKVWDSFWLVEVIQLLKAFALVSTEGADKSTMVSMYLLVYAWACDRQNANG